MSLHLNDFLNFKPNYQGPQVVVRGKRGENEVVIEGIKILSHGQQIGYTYHTKDGLLEMHYFNKKTQKDNILIKEIIRSKNSFNKSLKGAETAVSYLTER